MLGLYQQRSREKEMTPEERYLSICAAIEELEKEKTALAKQILDENIEDGEICSGLRRCRNQILNQDKLKASITDSQWRKITERKVVMPYLTAEIKRGSIGKEVVDSCKEPGKPYLKRM